MYVSEFGKKVQQSASMSVDHSYLLHPEKVSMLANLFDFLICSEEDSSLPMRKYYHLTPDLTTNPYPTIHCQLWKFIGPEDQLLDITFEQFMYLQTYLDAMHSDPTKIDHLLACLWHRNKVFDINQLDKDAAILHHLPEDRKILMYWYILGSLSCMANSYPRNFFQERERVVTVAYSTHSSAFLIPWHSPT